eukprot:5747160-Pyramimonas_sp.AAC.1
MAVRIDPADEIELMVRVNNMQISSRALIQTRLVKVDIRQSRGLLIRVEAILLKTPPPEPPAPPKLWGAACMPRANPLRVESVWFVTAASLGLYTLVSLLFSSSASLGQSRPQWSSSPGQYLHG